MMSQLPNSKAFIAKQVLSQQFLNYEELQQVPTLAKHYTIQGCCLQAETSACHPSSEGQQQCLACTCLH
jgi:hypothetical protein